MNPSKQLSKHITCCCKRRRLNQFIRCAERVEVSLPKKLIPAQDISCQRRWASWKPSRSDAQYYNDPQPPKERPSGRVSHRVKHYTPTKRGIEPTLYNMVLNPSRPNDDDVVDSETMPTLAHGSSLLMDAETNGMHRAVIAVGSNLGDRIAHIENALDRMRSNGLKILKLSRLYETQPMYYEEQDTFLNGAVLIETELEPIALLDTLQNIENELGRIRDIEKGPRTLDLDIVLYDKEQINHERLKVPHPLFLEREFVLRPLAE